MEEDENDMLDVQLKIKGRQERQGRKKDKLLYLLVTQWLHNSPNAGTILLTPCPCPCPPDMLSAASTRTHTHTHAHT